MQRAAATPDLGLPGAASSILSVKVTVKVLTAAGYGDDCPILPRTLYSVYLIC
jgi:hypothetical protein